MARQEMSSCKYHEGRPNDHWCKLFRRSITSDDCVYCKAFYLLKKPAKR